MAFTQGFSASVTAATDIGPTTTTNGFKIKIGAVEFLNTTAAVAYVQLFPKPASGVTLGTTAPTFSFGLPANGGMTLGFGPEGWVFGGTGVSVAGTTTRTGASTAAVDVNFIYQ